MVDRLCRSRLDLFPPSKANTMLKKYSIINDIALVLHVSAGNQINININRIRNTGITDK